MYLSLHNAGVCITLPTACNDHAVTLIWDEWRDGKGYWLAGAWCEQCAGTYFPVDNEFHAPVFASASDTLALCDDLGGY